VSVVPIRKKGGVGFISVRIIEGGEKRFPTKFWPFEKWFRKKNLSQKKKKREMSSAPREGRKGGNTFASSMEEKR